MRAARVILIGESSREILSLAEAGEALDLFGIAHVGMKLDASSGEIRAKLASGARIAVVAVSSDPGLAVELAAETDFAVIAVPLTEKALYRLSERAKAESSPLAIVAIGGGYNAGLLAAQFHASGSPEGGGLYRALLSYKEGLRRKVLSKRL